MVKSVTKQLDNWKLGGPDGTCWIYQGFKEPNGYGRFRAGGIRTSAHRAAYQAAHPDEDMGELYVCHGCDTPACINPAHLFLGTPRENFEDMYNKGRFTLKGERHSRCKLSDSDVLEIRELLKRKITQKVIAEKFG